MIRVKYNAIQTFAGDSNKILVPLARAGVVDWDAYVFNFTAKTDKALPDTEASVQKVTGVGLTVVDGFATLDIVNEDTLAFATTELLYCDIRGQHVETGAFTTFASFLWTVEKGVGESVESSVPIYTTEPPAPSGANITHVGNSVCVFNDGGTLRYFLTSTTNPLA